ncbi:hypothetical protein NMY22_g2371 [Coprinellus aureogranulatus]|nr:hypothetical protein NMY22_g2371 [Coprinellus aureogranulatus]
MRLRIVHALAPRFEYGMVGDARWICRGRPGASPLLLSMMLGRRRVPGSDYRPFHPMVDGGPHSFVRSSIYPLIYRRPRTSAIHSTRLASFTPPPSLLPFPSLLPLSVLPLPPPPPPQSINAQTHKRTNERTHEPKGPSELKLQISISTSKTVQDLKSAIAEKSDVEAARQRLIYSGRVLKDEDKLDVYKIQSGHTVHMVKGAAKPPTSSTSSSSQPLPTNITAGQNPSDPLTQLNSSQLFGNPGVAGLNSAGTASTTGGFNPFAAMGMGNINPNDPNFMQTMMQDPQFLEQMGRMLADPNVVEQMIAMNPQMAGMAPQIRETVNSEAFRNMVYVPLPFLLPFLLPSPSSLLLLSPLSLSFPFSSTPTSHLKPENVLICIDDVEAVISAEMASSLAQPLSPSAGVDPADPNFAFESILPSFPASSFLRVLLFAFASCPWMSFVSLDEFCVRRRVSCLSTNRPVPNTPVLYPYPFLTPPFHYPYPFSFGDAILTMLVNDSRTQRRRDLLVCRRVKEEGGTRRLGVRGTCSAFLCYPLLPSLSPSPSPLLPSLYLPSTPTYLLLRPTFYSDLPFHSIPVFITGSQPLPSPSSSFGSSPMLDKWAFGMTKLDGGSGVRRSSFFFRLSFDLAFFRLGLVSFLRSFGSVFASLRFIESAFAFLRSFVNLNSPPFYRLHPAFFDTFYPRSPFPLYRSIRVRPSYPITYGYDPRSPMFHFVSFPRDKDDQTSSSKGSSVQEKAGLSTIKRNVSQDLAAEVNNVTLDTRGSFVAPPSTSPVNSTTVQPGSGGVQPSEGVGAGGAGGKSKPVPVPQAAAHPAADLGEGQPGSNTTSRTTSRRGSTAVLKSYSAPSGARVRIFGVWLVCFGPVVRDSFLVEFRFRRAFVSWVLHLVLLGEVIDWASSLLSWCPIYTGPSRRGRGEKEFGSMATLFWARRGVLMRFLYRPDRASVSWLFQFPRHVHDMLRCVLCFAASNLLSFLLPVRAVVGGMGVVAETGRDEKAWSSWVQLGLFELITGGDYLFDPASGTRYSKDDDHIAQIMELLGEIPRSVAFSGKYSGEFFTRKGELRHINKLRYWPLDAVLHDKYLFPKADAEALASFLHPMLRLHPDRRAKASELVHHYWLEGVVVQGEIDVVRRAEAEELARKERERQAREEQASKNSKAKERSRTREREDKSDAGRERKRLTMDFDTFDADEADALKPIDASVYIDQTAEEAPAAVPVIQAPITPGHTGGSAAAAGHTGPSGNERTGGTGHAAATGHGGAPILNAPPIAGGLSRTAPGKKGGR